RAAERDVWKRRGDDHRLSRSARRAHRGGKSVAYRFNTREYSAGARREHTCRRAQTSNVEVQSYGSHDERHDDGAERDWIAGARLVPLGYRRISWWGAFQC